MSRILLVEDHRVFSQSFAHLLEREPDPELVGVTESAADCRAFLAGEGGGGGGFDVAIVDLFLPDADGSELSEELRECCAGVPVLVLTISGDPQDHARAREAGADEVLTKDAGIREIVAAMRRLSASSGGGADA